MELDVRLALDNKIKSYYELTEDSYNSYDEDNYMQGGTMLCKISDNGTKIIKTIRPEYLESNSVKNCYFNELKVLSKLKISTRVLDNLVLETEYKGKSLVGLIRNNEISYKTYLHICLETLKAVSKLHNKGIVHGDVKFDNVCIDNKNKVDLIDYGCSSIIKEHKKRADYIAYNRFSRKEKKEYNYEQKVIDDWYEFNGSMKYFTEKFADVNNDVREEFLVKINGVSNYDYKKMEKLIREEMIKVG